VPAARGDEITVLDVSVAANRDGLQRLLAAGARIRWFDHHHPGDPPPPAHPGLELHVDTGRDVCTSLLVDRHLDHRHAAWAVVGAYGDNLVGPAEALTDRMGLAAGERARLRALGESLNHNAYGDDEADLLVHPLALSQAMRTFVNPLAFADTALVARLDARREADLQAAQEVQPHAVTPKTAVYLLEDAPWARRVRGVLGNLLVDREPARAHAIASPDRLGGWTVSVRIPASIGRADAFCRRYPTGGGRAAAGGINHLPRDAIVAFIDAFQREFDSDLR